MRLFGLEQSYIGDQAQIQKGHVTCDKVSDDDWSLFSSPEMTKIRLKEDDAPEQFDNKTDIWSAA